MVRREAVCIALLFPRLTMMATNSFELSRLLEVHRVRKGEQILCSSIERVPPIVIGTPIVTPIAAAAVCSRCRSLLEQW